MTATRRVNWSLEADVVEDVDLLGEIVGINRRKATLVNDLLRAALTPYQDALASAREARRKLARRRRMAENGSESAYPLPSPTPIDVPS